MLRARSTGHMLRPSCCEKHRTLVRFGYRSALASPNNARWPRRRSQDVCFWFDKDGTPLPLAHQAGRSGIHPQQTSERLPPHLSERLHFG
jgi:hypothetical protein